MDVYENLASTFSALGDPTRLAILAHLAKSPASCNELVARFDMTQQSVSKHIQVLREAKLLRQRKEGRVRICELEPDALNKANAWIEQNRSMWMSRFDQLDTYLRQNKKRTSSGRRKSKRG